ncbi:hypothetical protein [Thiomonas sp.]|jgi:hypothetical protein|uniref:hypothetical protein n=1 Tax=Thiomonas sp. TaxID=2047785 RepID=UPI0026036A51|nr:hypothetical protein [Thiomonas sp.]
MLFLPSGRRQLHDVEGKKRNEIDENQEASELPCAQVLRRSPVEALTPAAAPHAPVRWAPARSRV